MREHEKEKIQNHNNMYFVTQKNTIYFLQQ
jgi:hypothetical protein